MPIGAKIPVIPSPTASQRVKPPPGQETKAPSGRSTAGKMVQNRRQQKRQNVPHPPRGRGGPSKPPYDPLASPYKTQGQFDQAVARTSKAQYQPELDQVNKEETGEKGLHGVRSGENQKIYENYYQQALQAQERAKGALGEIAARQNASTDAGQKALQAALSNSGVSGLQGVANPSSFMQEAAGYGNASSQALAGLQSGDITAANQATLIPGTWLNEQTGEERQRNQSKLAEISEGRRKVLGNIPNIQSKVRGELSKQEQERAQVGLQNQIAGKKLGLEGQDIRGKRKGEQEGNALKERELGANVQLKHEEMLQAAGFKTEELKVQREQINASIQNAKGQRDKEAAIAAGKRFDHGVEIMLGYLKMDPKTEFQPVDEGGPKDKVFEGEKKTAYRKDAMHLYTMLTKQGNLTAPEAFRIMKSSGNGYVEKFADEHEKIYNAAIKQRQDTRRKAGGPLKTLPKVPKKGQNLPTLRAPSH